MNELQKTVVVCEAFILEERIDAYVFILNSLFKMTPTFDKNNLSVIFGDEFITDKILLGTGLHHVKIFNDHYHLKDKYERRLGNLYRRASQYISNIFCAKSKKI